MHPDRQEARGRGPHAHGNGPDVPKERGGDARPLPPGAGAFDNTASIARRCNVEFEFGKYHLPDFPVPNGEPHDEYLHRLCLEGALRRYARWRAR